MIAFYWVMAGLTVATIFPSALYTLLYAFIGEEACLRRARALFRWAASYRLRVPRGGTARRAVG